MLEISKKLEIEYMEKFIGKKLLFIPEKYEDGFLMGHTGNYLAIKSTGKKEELHQNVEVILEKVSYPYVMAKRVD